MSLRKYQNPATLELPRELMDVLSRNGMQATIIIDRQSQQPLLMVQSHDSPVLSYRLTRNQLDKLTQYGSNFLNKQAYNTFADIVKDDFDMPRNWVYARNVNTRVSMGLHGYRMDQMAPYYQRGLGMFDGIRHGRPFGMGGMNRRGLWQVMTPGLAFGPRMQDGFHLRRMGGMLVSPHGAPIVPERYNGVVKPGEMQSGAYGFYWKGSSPQLGTPRSYGMDPLEELKQGFQPVALPARNQDPAISLKEAISSPVYFSSEKFLEVLSSHGIVIDEASKVLTVQSASVPYDVSYDIKEEDLKILTSSSVKEHSIEERLKVINENYLQGDYATPLTLDILNSKEVYASPMTEEAAKDIRLAEEVCKESDRGMTDDQILEVSQTPIRADGMVIPLVSEKEGYHWQQDIRHGRDVVLGNVVAYENEGKSFLHAEVNGVVFEKELTKDEFRELHYRNDDRRLELIDKHLDGIRLEEGDYKGEFVNVAVTDGREVSLHAEKGWYREGRDGRAVEVGDIAVSRQSEGKFIMTAEIDGQTVSHEISQKDFDKFLKLDDFHRMKLFSKIFDEVDMKNSGDVGMKVGAAIAATLTVIGEISAIPMMSHPQGELQHRAYFKPGVDSPADIAARNFEAAMITEQIHQGLNR